MKFYVISLAILMCITMISGQTLLLDPAHDAPQIFLIKRVPIKVYKDPNSDQFTEKKFPLGKLFFASNKRQDRVLLVEHEQGSTSPIGWCNTRDLLLRGSSLVVEDVIKKYPDFQTELPTPIPGIKNRLCFKVLPIPEMLVEVSLHPPHGSTKKISNHTWYYVYDIEQHEKDYYLLLGTRERIWDFRAQETQTQLESQYVLLGWVKKENIQFWGHSIVYEYNGEQAAVEERRQNQMPVCIYAQPDFQSQILAKESLEKWGQDWDYAPIGVPPDFPRFFVIQRVQENWLKIASYGDISQSSWDFQKIQKTLQQLQQVISQLRKVSLVFVMDATGSMESEIQSVQKFLEKIYDALLNFQSQQSPFILEIGGKKSALPISMEISTSFLIYQDIRGQDIEGLANIKKEKWCKTSVLWKNWKLEENIQDIKQQLNFLQTHLKGEREALHAGIYRVFQEPEFWKENQSGIRIVVVVANEPGDSDPSCTQEKICKIMPYPSIQGKNVDDLKKQYTWIYGIYTDSTPGGFEAFKDNLSKLTFPERLFCIPLDIEESEEDQKKLEKAKEELIGALLKPLRKAASRIKQRVELFQKKIEQQENVSSSNLGLILDQIVIQHAMERAHLDFKSLYQRTQGIAFVKGYLPIMRKGEKFPSVLPRVLISRQQLQNLTDVLTRFLSSIRRRKRHRKNRKLYIAESLVIGICYATGISPPTSTELTQRAREILRSKNSVPLSFLLNLRDSLPISSHGILSLTCREICNLPLDKFYGYINELSRKNKQLLRVIRNECEEKGRILFKNWFFSHPISQIDFAYIPLDYLP